MQISHLSTARLQPYGQILSAFPPAEGLFESQPHFTKTSQIAQYAASGVTVLDYVSGMSVLVLYREGQTEQFYLDRVVSLQPGVKFSLFPVGDTCCIRLLTDVQTLQPVAYLSAVALEAPARGAADHGADRTAAGVFQSAAILPSIPECVRNHTI